MSSKKMKKKRRTGGRSLFGEKCYTLAPGRENPVARATNEKAQKIPSRPPQVDHKA